MMGELKSQPLQFTTEVTNRDDVSKKLEKKNMMFAESLLKPYMKELSETMGIEVSEQDLGGEMPKDIETLMNAPFKINKEEVINDSFHYLIDKHDLKNVFSRVMIDILTTGKGYFHVERQNIDPVPRKIDPRNMIIPYVDDREDYKKCAYIGYEQMLTLNQDRDWETTLTSS